MAFLRLMLMLIVALGVVYICLLLYMRAGRRDRLTREYQQSAPLRDRDTFIDAQLDVYMGKLRPRLAVIVFVLPLAVLTIIVYVTNFW